MGLKLFFPLFFIALLFYMAIGEPIFIGSKLSDIEVLELPIEVDDKVEESNEVSTHAICPKAKALTENKTEVTDKKLLKKEPVAENLSFNFIYYILYKFKYIDIFELVRPSK